MADNVFDFPLISPGLEICSYINEKVGDAIVRIQQGNNIIDMTPLQALEALSVLSSTIYEAMEFNNENGFDLSAKIDEE